MHSKLNLKNKPHFHDKRFQLQGCLQTTRVTSKSVSKLHQTKIQYFHQLIQRLHLNKIYIMQRKLSLGNNYHIIVRVIDQRPLLIFPKSPENKIRQLHKYDLDDSASSLKRTLTGVFSADVYKQSSQPKNTQTKTISCNINSSNTLNKTGVKQQTKYGQLKKTKDTEGEGRESSIINQLIVMTSEAQGQTFKSEHFNGLESIQCIECTSIHDGDSYDFEQADSEIMSLTNEEKQFFHNFITPELKDNEQIQELFNRLSLQTTQVIPLPNREVKSLPQNKLKVIRNFFKPKEGITKHQRKQCDSFAFLEEIVQKLKGKQILNHPSLTQQQYKSK